MSLDSNRKRNLVLADRIIDRITILQLIEFLQQLFDFFDEDLPLVSRNHTLSGPRENDDPELVLNFLDRPAQAWLRNKEDFCRFVDRAYRTYQHDVAQCLHAKHDALPLL